METLDAIVNDVVFSSDDGRFAVLRVVEADDDDDPPRLLTAVGALCRVRAGEHLRLVGNWTTHSVYGARFRVDGFVPTIPTTVAGIKKYLGSGLIPGVGKALAERIVEAFGARTLDVITTESVRLRGVSGIGEQRAASIAEAVRERRLEAEALSFLHGIGLGPAAARDVIERYGVEQAPQAVQRDPYALSEHVRGIGFLTADKIARALGITYDDLRRVQGGVLHALAKAEDQGHVFLFEDQLSNALESLDVPSERLEDALVALDQRGRIVRDDDAVYPPDLHSAELEVADALAVLAARELEQFAPPTRDTQLTDAQWLAVETSLRVSLMVLTGGPGTGKTTTVRAVVAAHAQLGHKISLCAPTGRAAKRLSEAAGHEARTIHRLLEWNPGNGTFQRDARNPLEADLLLVDEASMLDLMLASQLLRAVGEGCRVMLVGDVDQLPPVGAGQPLRDLIDSEVCETVRLSEVIRQAQHSSIVQGAHAVLRGEMPEPTEDGAGSANGDLFIVRGTTPEQIVERIDRTLERMVARYGLDPKRDVQVLTPMRKGAIGTERLNAWLQQRLNPTKQVAFVPEESDRPARPVLRVGDKVMQLRNDYEREVFNGDLGEVLRIQGPTTFIAFDGREVQYTVESLDAVALAYASTVHKVQGSEFPAVIVVLHSSHFVLLNRSLLYTALTRARQLVVLVGDPRAYHRAIQNATSNKLNARLRDRLQSRVNQ